MPPLRRVNEFDRKPMLCHTSLLFSFSFFTGFYRSIPIPVNLAAIYVPITLKILSLCSILLFHLFICKRALSPGKPLLFCCVLDHSHPLSNVRLLILCLQHNASLPSFCPLYQGDASYYYWGALQGSSFNVPCCWEWYYPHITYPIPFQGVRAGTSLETSLPSVRPS